MQTPVSAGRRYTSSVSQKKEFQQIDSLVGAAIRGLVESGATDTRIGAFAAEHRVKVAQILGLAPDAPDAPDLLAIVTEAVKAALANTKHAQRRPLGPEGSQAVNVLVGGKRTSVKVSRGVLTRIEESRGGRAPARALVEALSNQVPSYITNRSRWVEGELIKLLDMDSSANSGLRH